MPARPRSGAADRRDERDVLALHVVEEAIEAEAEGGSKADEGVEGRDSQAEHDGDEQVEEAEEGEGLEDELVDIHVLNGVGGRKHLSGGGQDETDDGGPHSYSRGVGLHDRRIDLVGRFGRAALGAGQHLLDGDRRVEVRAPGRACGLLHFHAQFALLGKKGGLELVGGPDGGPILNGRIVPEGFHGHLAGLGQRDQLFQVEGTPGFVLGRLANIVFLRGH